MGKDLLIRQLLRESLDGQHSVADAAKAAGYTVGPVWHGTADDGWYEFTRKTTSSVFGKVGFFFSPMKAVAESHARKATGYTHNGRVIEAWLKSPSVVPPNKLSLGIAEYVVTASADIKLADQVTYDDNGNEIPLDQRFDPSNPDIRY